MEESIILLITAISNWFSHAPYFINHSPLLLFLTCTTLYKSLLSVTISHLHLVLRLLLSVFISHLHLTLQVLLSVLISHLHLTGYSYHYLFLTCTICYCFIRIDTLVKFSSIEQVLQVLLNFWNTSRASN